MQGGSESGLILPSFRKPPVVEVAMSIGFAPMVGLNFAAMADLRSRWIDSYPGAEEQPLLESPSTPQQSIKVEFGFGPPPRRLWLLSSGGDRVIQIQRDRLIANWRAVPGSGEPYPRYGPLRDEFLQRWSDFEKFIVEHGLTQSLQPQYAEVTYVNVIKTDDDGKLDISAVLKMDRRGDLWRDDMATVAVNQSWEVHDLQTFLTMAANVDSSSPDLPIVLQISANTQTREGRGTAIALDLAHDFVVGTFGVVTTDEMQQRWERTE
ncbi:TIGR04255 family protein [Mycobacterium sp. 852002-51057_SCH5723018]|uniref:TIGR04255 family protein n=1 Tax=Mycobacterium sp. 852002-51057_SCH5723018 TaxID=1834094 RepID=UPI0018D29AE0|nr:TIGR04255 family protein [Mycobacterium sp. 852002-51057_SCH5723018]